MLPILVRGMDLTTGARVKKIDEEESDIHICVNHLHAAIQNTGKRQRENTAPSFHMPVRVLPTSPQHLLIPDQL